MKAFCILIAAIAPLLAQEPPSAPPVVQLRPLDLSFQGVQLPGRPPVSFMKAPVVLQAQVKTCAIPLIQVPPKGNYPLVIVKPPETESNMPKVNVPAPACE
jgi:hypothetical protein